MFKIFRKISLLAVGFLLWFIMPAAAETTVSAEVGFIFNTFLFLVCGFLVMFMAAGFAMLEAGMVTSKSVSVICAKNIGLFSIAGIMFWMFGYNLAYGIPEGGYIGKFLPWSDASAVDTGYSDGSDWYFQMVFCATTVSIVSGTMAERIKLWPFFLFAAILSGIIYPIVMGWQWGGGWLASAGFSDFAGSTLVHSTGGAAALAGVILLGPRLGRFTKSGEAAPVKPFAASSIPLVTIGIFILWLGWFGFNGGSQLALGSGADATAVADIFVNTNLAAAGGVLASMIVSKLTNSHTNIFATLNGAIAGLVAITAEPLTPSMGQAVVIGAIGGIICMYGMKLLDALKIDDVVMAIPAHLFAGIWGTLVVAWTNPDASLKVQLLGVVSYGLFTLITCFIVWFIIKTIIGIRAGKEDEEYGLDMSELGAVSFPDFTKK